MNNFILPPIYIKIEHILREINPNVAKEFGFTKSYKRLSKALELAKKVQDLVKAARQDMLGLYTDNENNKTLSLMNP